jgi:GAF domain-containing protein
MAGALSTSYDASFPAIWVEAMKRRSRAGGKPAKARPRKALKLKGQNAPKTVRNRRSAADQPEPEVAQLKRELHEALEQQTATAEILRVISSSPGDLQSVFEAILGNATRICEAKLGNLWLREGDKFRIVAVYGGSPEYREYLFAEPLVVLDPQDATNRVVSDREVVQIDDISKAPTYGMRMRIATIKIAKARTLVGVPLLKDNEVVGIIAIYRQEVRPFTEKQIELLTSFAAQAVIAIENARLLNELRQRTTDLTESLEQQTATSEVLQVISSSPGDVQPVFEAMLEKAIRICGATFGNLFLCEDGAFRVVAMHNAPPAYAEARMLEPIHPGPATALGRLARTKQAAQIDDLMAEPGYIARDPLMVTGVEVGGIRTLVAVPMLKANELVGSIVIYRHEVRRFSKKQVEIVSNFAAQAVIAIENARLLNELRESLQEQTATSEVLQVISSSPGDLQPVFEAMLEKAVRICDAKFGNIYRWDGDALYLVATRNTPPAFAAEARKRSQYRPDPKTVTGRMLETTAVVHIADLAAESAYIEERHPAFVAGVELGGVRTILAVPMLKEDKLIGSFTVYRQEVRPFTDKQIALVRNFAAQAVIAIENARLLAELRESLQEQTATAEVLEAISGSPGDLEPVFAAMLEKAARICDAAFGNIYRWDGDALHLVGTHNTPPALAEARRRSPARPDPDTPFGRMLASKTVAHITDLAAEEVYTERRHPGVVAAVELGGVRTILLVPIVKEDELIGVFSLYRQEVRPFTDKQIALVQNFASQAVIAIENARLLNDLRQRTTDLIESLEQQTATSEVLQVISSSPGDLEPVFAAMLENAVRVCDATFGNIYRWDDDALHLVAAHNTPSAFAEYRRRVPMQFDQMPESMRQMIKTMGPIQVDPLAVLDHEPKNAIARSGVELGGIRTVLNVPMLKEKELVGAFMLSRHEVRPFTDKQVTLVMNFARQAAIAIENARLLKELHQRTTNLTEALEQQRATSEVLQVISASPGDLEPVFATILEKAVRICDAKFGTLFRLEGDALRLVASTQDVSLAYAEAQRKEPFYPAPGGFADTVMKTRQTVHLLDLRETRSYVERHPRMIEAVEIAGIRTVVGVPMLKDNELIGIIGIYRQEVRSFADKQIELLTNFAAQAVIAMENARLLKELRENAVQLEAQSRKVIKLNQQLEQRVADQVGEIERMSRLRRFLPPQVADLIVASGSEKQLESHRREITALFCDLRGFTGFSESADPEDVMALLRDYHAAIGEIIIKYSGTLERYAGDGVMVVFNDPVPVEKPALQAVLMALEMRNVIGALTEKWRRLGHEIGFGIGIAHGFATLGTIGFEGRFDYAAIGTVSNVASRLCDEAKPGQILISPRVLMAVEDAVTVEPVGEFELKGIRRPIAAYNVLAAASPNA